MTVMELLNRAGGMAISVYYRVRYPLKGPEWIMEINGTKIAVRRGTSDLFIAREVLSDNTYGEESPKGVVFDLGANIGCYSLYASKTASHVYAFEPDNENHARALKNISLNGRTNITMHKKAISGAHGTATLYRLPGNQGAHSLAAAQSSDTQEVEAITLQEAMELCGVSHINCLKIDIEGSEYDVFENTPDDILRRIDRIEMEMHPAPGKSASGLLKRLRDCGFTVKHRFTIFSFLSNFFGYSIITAQR